MSVEHWHRVQQFLFQEARLLDERRLQEWLALYADDAEYWVPYAWNQQSPKDHVSLFYETKKLLGMRVDRLERELSPLDTPMARTNHYLSNVTVDDDDRARAYLFFVEYRREDPQVPSTGRARTARAQRLCPRRGRRRRPASGRPP